MPVSATDVEQKISRLNERRDEQMTEFEQRQMDEGAKSPVYIYNVSKIHQHDQNHGGQLGTVRIAKCEPGKQVSEPAIINGVVARRYDAGFGKRRWMLEDGMDIAMDLCQCNPKYPSENSRNNLLNYGVFITRAPFEELVEKREGETDPQYQRRLEKEQTKILAAPIAAYEKKLRSLVLEADRFHSSPKADGAPDPKIYIVNIHLDALNALNEILVTRGQAEEKRPWAPVGYKGGLAQKDCKFCGRPMPSDKPKCPTCGEIVDQELYDKMKKG